MEVIQIVPRLPPAVDGVGDYAYRLAKQLRAAHGIHTRFVVCDPTWEKAESRKQKVESGDLRPEMGKSDGRWQMADGENPASDLWLEGFPVHRLRERSAAELVRVLSVPGMPATVLLQYVGYGYEKRGCPLWLVRALRDWEKAKTLKPEKLKWGDRGRGPEDGGRRPEAGRRHLVTMFHELYAMGWPWQSSFWTSPVQRWIAQALARSSDHCFTNRKASATWLAAGLRSPVSSISVLPVFSNVGEPEELPQWDERPPRMIVFGSASQRRQVYAGHRAELERACQSMNLVEIVDIGAPLKIPPLAVPVLQLGILSAPQVSREMLLARAGFFVYPTAYLGKSGVFAAYAAHGLIPVTFCANQGSNEDGLKADEHYLFASAVEKDEVGTIAANLQDWYHTHGTRAQAGCYAKTLLKNAYSSPYPLLSQCGRG